MFLIEFVNEMKNYWYHIICSSGIPETFDLWFIRTFKEIPRSEFYEAWYKSRSVDKYWTSRG